MSFDQKIGVPPYPPGIQKKVYIKKNKIKRFQGNGRDFDGFLRFAILSSMSTRIYKKGETFKKLSIRVASHLEARLGWKNMGFDLLLRFALLTNTILTNQTALKSLSVHKPTCKYLNGFYCKKAFKKATTFSENQNGPKLRNIIPKCTLSGCFQQQYLVRPFVTGIFFDLNSFRSQCMFGKYL